MPALAVVAHVACTVHGRPVADGARVVLDDDLHCAVVVDRRPADVWYRVSVGHLAITSVLPFGETPPVELVLAPDGPELPGYTAERDVAPDELLRCGDLRVAAELDGGDGVLWRGALHFHGACARPRVRPSASCNRVYVFRGTGEVPSYGTFDHAAIECGVTIDHAPPIAVHTYARYRGATIDSEGDGVELRAPDGDGCPPGRVELAVTTADGALLWRDRVPIRCDQVIEELRPY